MPESDTGTELVEASAAVVDRTEAETDRARQLAHESRTEGTWKAYEADLGHFGAWCADRNLQALPAAPATVARYLADLETIYKPSTIRRRMAAISVAHQVAGHPTPTADPGVQAVWAGIRRRHGIAPRKVKAARTKVVAKMVEGLDDGLGEVRDRALLLMGFAGALRRSELVALDVGDVTEDEAGLRVVIRRSKTDPEAEGQVRGLPYGSHPGTCPVRAWRAWLAASGVTEGPAFRAVDRHGRLGQGRLSDRAIADMIKRRALATGLDPATFSGHSLRAGFATESYAQGVPELAIMRHGRWRSASTMRGYVEEGSVWNDNAAARLGL